MEGLTVANVNRTMKIVDGLIISSLKVKKILEKNGRKKVGKVVARRCRNYVCLYAALLSHKSRSFSESHALKLICL